MKQIYLKSEHLFWILCILLLIIEGSSANDMRGWTSFTNFPPGALYSAQLTSQNKWEIVAGHSKNASAWGKLDDLRNVSGWAILNLHSQLTTEDQMQAYAAGFLEGGITQPLIWDAFRTFCNGTSCLIPKKLSKFMLTNDEWVRKQSINSSTSNQDFWQHANLVLKQFDGIYDGYSQYAPADQKIEYAQFLLFNLQNEFEDILRALKLPNPLPHLRSTWKTNEHCSALIKLSSDGSELYASHVTWYSYTTMLRVFKHYDLPFQLTSNKAPRSSFSSYPGWVMSTDDYTITSQKLVIIETTNGVMNESLFQYVTTETVPYWIRTVVANRISTTGKQWVHYFSLYNSGTYNNQWIVVDYKKFSPGQPITSGTLWIAEQIPGYVISQDMSSFLKSTLHWPSYNVPYFPFIYNISGYPEYYKKYGDEYSYTKCARAKIFARDYQAVESLEDMKHIMRYNKWQTDPLSQGDACLSISARCDLEDPSVDDPSPGGALDGKITTSQLVSDLKSVAVCGPTWDSQPIFAWTEEWSDYPSYGQPQVFAFNWVPMQPSD